MPSTTVTPDPRAPSTFILIFDSLVSSGCLARLSGSAFKTLLLLSLTATPLGTSSRQSRAFFQHLLATGAVTPRDRGRLCACLSYSELVRRTGLSKNTLCRCTTELEAKQMIEKRRARQPDGTACNLFFLLPGSHMDKFNTLRREAHTATVPESGSSASAHPISETPPVPESGAAPSACPISETSPVPESGAAPSACPISETSPVPESGSTAPARPISETSPVPESGSTASARPISETSPVPESGSTASACPISQATPRPKSGTNYKKLDLTTTPPTSGGRAKTWDGLGSEPGLSAERGTDLDSDAVLAYFGRRCRAGPPGPDTDNAYRPTSHDRRKLAFLRQAGYSQVELIAAIDRAFAPRPADAPPIRMFSYCATLALATPPRPPAPAAGPSSWATPAGPALLDLDASRGAPQRAIHCGGSAPAGTATQVDRPPVLAHARQLYQAEIGPVTPAVDKELRRLADQYADPVTWDTAFREAVLANVRQLRYVARVLEARARGTPPTHVPPRGSPPRRGTEAPSPRSRTRSQPGRWSLTDEALAEAQRRGAAVEPVDLVALLGTPHACSRRTCPGEWGA